MCRVFPGQQDDRCGDGVVEQLRGLGNCVQKCGKMEQGLVCCNKGTGFYSCHEGNTLGGYGIIVLNALEVCSNCSLENGLKKQEWDEGDQL